MQLLADEWQVFERFADHDMFRLRAELQPIRLSGELVEFIADRPGEPVPDYCDSIWRVSAHLTSRPGIAPRRTWLEFLERLAAQVPDSSPQRFRDLIQAFADTGGRDWLDLERFRGLRAPGLTPPRAQPVSV